MKHFRNFSLNVENSAKNERDRQNYLISELLSSGDESSDGVPKVVSNVKRATAVGPFNIKSTLASQKNRIFTYKSLMRYDESDHRRSSDDETAELTDR